jgi:hypothetical protein
VPQNTDNSDSGLEDDEVVVVVAMTFRLVVASRVWAGNGAMYAQCINGRPAATSIAAGEVGGGGRGMFGGGTGGDLQRARWELKITHTHKWELVSARQNSW